MPYNSQLALRIRRILQKCVQHSTPGGLNPTRKTFNSIRLASHKIEEEDAFGGIAFLINGKISAAVLRDDLVLRIGQITPTLINSSLVELVDVCGQPLSGWLLLTKSNTFSDQELFDCLKAAVNNTTSVNNHSLIEY